MVSAGNVGNWMRLFGGGNLSAVTGSWSHPTPKFTILACPALCCQKYLISMYSLPPENYVGENWNSIVRYRLRGGGTK